MNEGLTGLEQHFLKILGELSLLNYTQLCSIINYSGVQGNEFINLLYITHVTAALCLLCFFDASM